MADRVAEGGLTERERLTQWLVAGYRRGRSLAALSEDAGRSYGYVRRLLLDAGVTLRRRGGPRPRH